MNIYRHLITGRVICSNDESMPSHWEKINPPIKKSPAQLKPQTCQWTLDNGDGSEDDIWATQCNHLYVFIDGDPESNHWKFCPYCGGAITT